MVAGGGRWFFAVSPFTARPVMRIVNFRPEQARARRFRTGQPGRTFGGAMVSTGMGKPELQVEAPLAS